MVEEQNECIGYIEEKGGWVNETRVWLVGELRRSIGLFWVLRKQWDYVENENLFFISRSQYKEQLYLMLISCRLLFIFLFFICIFHSTNNWGNCIHAVCKAI